MNAAVQGGLNSLWPEKRQQASAYFSLVLKNVCMWHVTVCTCMLYVYVCVHVCVQCVCVHVCDCVLIALKL